MIIKIILNPIYNTFKYEFKKNLKLIHYFDYLLKMKAFIDTKIINDSNIQKFEILGLKKYENFKDVPNFDNSLNEQYKNSIINDKYVIINSFYYYKNFFKYTFISFIFLLIYLFYYLSLEKCLEGEGKCSDKIDWIMKKIKEEIYSCILMEIMIQLMIFKIISKKHLIHIIILFIILFLYSHGFYFHDHGLFNFFFYVVILSFITVILIPLDCMLIYNKNRIFKKIIIILIIVYCFAHFIISNNYANCSEWSKGLNSTYIRNNKTLYGCQIQIPNLCLYNIFENLQDYSELTGKNCINENNGKNQKENILKQSTSPYLSKKIKRIGYPLLNKDPICFLDLSDYNNTLEKFFYKNLIDMDDKETINKIFKEKTPEVEIDFTIINNPKLKINLHYNQTLSKERKLLEKNTEPYSNNILILYFDSLSRANALRELKKTTKFFENFMKYQGGFHYKYPSENFHSFQFFKYHSFYGYTSVNYPFLFYGQNKTDVNKSLITKFFKENGFITSAANDYCYIDNTRTYHNLTLDEMYDHLLALCDPNNDHYNSYTIRCLYGKHNIEYLFEYTKQFWEKYRNNRKYSIIIDNHGHEGTFKVIKHIDGIIENFLKNLFNNNLLKDTTVFLLSDHGVGMPSIYYSTNFYKNEYDLPVLLLLINDRKNVTYEEQYKYIFENQQTFITAFDIYNTLGNLIYGKKYDVIDNSTQKKTTCKSAYGKSLFYKINSKQRYPMRYKYLGRFGISDNSCK